MSTPRTQFPRTNRSPRVAQPAALALLVAFLVLPAAGPAFAAGEVLIARGAAWSYLDDGSDQGSAWRAPAFDDSSWAVGHAELGYGDDDEYTVISYGDDPNAKHITAYFRHQFEIPDPSAWTGLELLLLRDDGAVVYLNGTEVRRDNLPAGEIAYDTEASGADGESDFHSSNIPAALLVAGSNVIAVEVHQSNDSSSDTSFDLELIGTGPGAPESLLRGPYLQLVSPTEVTVRWRTSNTELGRVRYGSSPTTHDSWLDEVSAGADHEVRLTGLTPATRYYYSVGTPDDPLVGDHRHWFETAPSVGDSGPRRFWVLGDSGTGDSDALRVKSAYLNLTAARPADLLLLLGDNAYPDGTDEEYQEAFFEIYPEVLRTTPAFSTIGNHELLSSDSESESGPYYEIFTLPRQAEAGGVASGTEAYYSFDYGNVHFVCLDTQGSDNDYDGPMLTWLHDDLAAADADWVIAFFHHPPYSKGSHDSDDSSGLIDARELILPILEDYGVDLVMAGHSHSYERSMLIDGHYGASSSLSSKMILDNGDGDPTGDGAYAKDSAGLAAHEGAVFVVAGSSGKTSSSGDLDHPVMVRGLEELGSVLIDVEGRTLDAQFISDTGAVLDSFRIEKAGGSVLFRDDFESSSTISWTHFVPIVH